MTEVIVKAEASATIFALFALTSYDASNLAIMIVSAVYQYLQRWLAISMRQTLAHVWRHRL